VLQPKNQMERAEWCAGCGIGGCQADAVLVAHCATFSCSWLNVSVRRCVAVSSFAFVVDLTLKRN